VFVVLLQAGKSRRLVAASVTRSNRERVALSVKFDSQH
jgi:hypothetical protein